MKTSSVGFETALHLALILLVGIVPYLNTLHAPFQFDEDTFLVDNPFVTKGVGVSHLKPDDELYKMTAHRYVGMMTFRINYVLHGLSVEGYHAFNLMVHVLNGLLIYVLLLLTFRTCLSEGTDISLGRGAAVLSALLFLSHPLQTEAVTYVHQRLAALVTFFYLLAVVAYAWSRLSPGTYLSPFLYALSLLAAVLAMKTKENAFTLPLCITLYEFLFFRGTARERILRLLPLLATMLVIPVTSLVFMERGWELSTKTHATLSRWDYLVTEFRVVVTYIRLLLLPINQNIDYDYPVYHSISEAGVLPSLLLLAAIFSAGVFVMFRFGREKFVRVVSFGILWFFLAISVESGLVPILSVINEYRVYLPSVGLFAAVSASVVILSKRSPKAGRIAKGLLAVIVCLFAFATFARNSLWSDGVRLWADTVKKSPGKALGYINLGNAYAKKDDFDKAIGTYSMVIERGMHHMDLYRNIGNIHFLKGDYEGAISAYRKSLSINNGDGRVLCRLGNAYLKSGQNTYAADAFERACRLGVPEGCENLRSIP